jgi:hypothetical protein
MMYMVRCDAHALDPNAIVPGQQRDNGLEAANEGIQGDTEQTDQEHQQYDEECSIPGCESVGVPDEISSGHDHAEDQPSKLLEFRHNNGGQYAL